MEKAADSSALLAILVERAGDERGQLRAFMDFSVRLFTEDGGLIRIAQLAGAGDPDIAALWETGEARRLETCRMLLRGWEKRGILREGLTERRAVDVLWAMSGPEFYSLFIRKRQWTTAEFSDCLYQMAVEQLLSSAVRRRR
jgi:hypothetical protein